jgi:predicted transcriptional regulator
MAIQEDMAIPRVKSTYSLDVETVAALDRVAKRWRVSKSEALRRAIRSVATEGADAANPAIEALEALQRSLHLTAAKARAWASETGSERRASSRRAEKRGA